MYIVNVVRIDWEAPLATVNSEYYNRPINLQKVYSYLGLIN
jgi:hypothetical protein